jgi:putative ABC transport system substrate-binding protein
MRGSTPRANPLTEGEIGAVLGRIGLLASDDRLRCVPLDGGVSSDIWRVEIGARKYCLKRALPQLKVSQIWEAPIERNDAEWKWLAEAEAVRSRKYAAELATSAPDVILATASETTAALREATRTLPIVFVGVTDPVGAGYVASLARPGGNATGFTFVEYGIGGKWLELLKEIAPGVTRAAILRDPTLPVGIGLLGAMQSLAPSLGMETTPIDVRDAGEIERAIADFARSPNSGLVVTPSPAAIANRKPIIALAAQHRLPAVYSPSTFIKDGGLISYGPDPIGIYRQAAGYVDRILKGERPADLPVQAPTKYELVINLKTAKTIGLTIPPAVLARADEVIE